MTNEQAAAKHALYPHLSLETIAYYAGRAAHDLGGKCGFTDPVLVASFEHGKRSARAEDRLNNDKEWDGDDQ